jgi:hypothetical protein
MMEEFEFADLISCSFIEFCYESGNETGERGVRITGCGVGVGGGDGGRG